MKCPDCEGQLVWLRETACEPPHYGCSGCGRVYKSNLEPFKPIVQGRDIRGA